MPNPDPSFLSERERYFDREVSDTTPGLMPSAVPPDALAPPKPDLTRVVVALTALCALTVATVTTVVLRAAVLQQTFFALGIVMGVSACLAVDAAFSILGRRKA